MAETKRDIGSSGCSWAMDDAKKNSLGLFLSIT